MSSTGSKLQPASGLIGLRVQLNAQGRWVVIDELWMDWDRRCISHALVHADENDPPWLVDWSDINWRSAMSPRDLN